MEGKRDASKILKEVRSKIEPPKKRCCIAIIPAKTLSRRLPHKNFLEVNGTPMTIWTLWKALHCPYIDHVAISTDNIDIVIDKLPQLASPVFSRAMLVARGEDIRHPDVALYWVIRDALKMLTTGVPPIVQDNPTHVVLMQPNVPTLPQEVIDQVVRAVVMERYNVARHYNLEGAETGGCCAYKAHALMEVGIMDAYNFAVWTDDPEVHTLEDLNTVEKIFLQRQEGRLDVDASG